MTMRAKFTFALPFALGALFLMSVPSPAIAQSGISPSVLSIQDDGSEMSADDELRYASREMRARVWHDKDDEEVYKRGEELRLYFRINQDSYVVMYRIDADGYTEVLWPTSRFDDGFVFGGHTYSVPGRASQLPLNVSNVKGVEYVEIIASEYPFDLRELGLDFHFDMDEVTDYAHQVAGDPFLAVNDINYAITGLEEDVDWVVTDWAHIYIEEQVDYARYTCTSCHTEEEEQYSPYVDSCTQVAVYNDWGWHTRWYASFGYYPLYCDAPYYYWDRWYYRPYYYSYYPVYYSWPSYGVYVRPYPVYAWRTHSSYRGDYVTYYGRGAASSPPLYDLDRAREISKGRERGVTRTPPSIATRGVRGGENGRVSQELLVRDTAPVRARDGRDLGTVRGHTASSRVGIRSGQARPTRTVRSLQTEEASRSAQAGVTRAGAERRVGDATQGPNSSGRRWTRPVVRNERDPNATGQSSGSVRDRGDAGVRRGESRVSPQSAGSSNDGRSERRLRSGSVQRRESSGQNTERRQASTPRRRDDSGQSTQRRQVSTPQRRESSSTPARRTAEPRKSQSSPRQSVTPPPRRSNNSGGSGGRSTVTPRKSTPPPAKSSTRGGSSGGSGSRGGSSGSSRSRGGRG